MWNTNTSQQPKFPLWLVNISIQYATLHPLLSGTPRWRLQNWLVFKFKQFFSYLIRFTEQRMWEESGKDVHHVRDGQKNQQEDRRGKSWDNTRYYQSLRLWIMFCNSAHALHLWSLTVCAAINKSGCFISNMLMSLVLENTEACFPKLDVSTVWAESIILSETAYGLLKTTLTVSKIHCLSFH